MKILNFFSIILILSFLNCKDLAKPADTKDAATDATNANAGPGLIYEPQPGTFHLKIHDAAAPGNIDNINIEIQQINLVKADGSIITISNDLHQFDLLDFAASNPLELFAGDIPTGQYTQIRFVLTDNNTIVVDGVQHPLQTPSSQQSGYKLDGAFEYTSGLFYSMDVHFDPNQSIQYHPGAGTYLLTPVMQITNTTLLNGPFRADGLISGTTDVSLINLKTDGSFDVITTKDPRIVTHGLYFFNLETKLMTLQISSATCAVCGNMTIPKENIWVTGIPDKIQVHSWGPQMIEGQVVNSAGIELMPVTFSKNDTMNITDYATYTTVEVTVNYPDASYNGKIGAIKFESTGVDSQIGYNTISNQQAVITLKVNNQKFGTGTTLNYSYRGFVVNSAANLNVYPLYSQSSLSALSQYLYNVTINRSGKTLKSNVNY